MRIRYILLPVFAAALSVTTASGSSRDLVSYDDLVDESFVATGTQCKSVAIVDAWIIGANGNRFPINNNVKARRSDCPKGAKIIVGLEVVWEYCNLDTDVQTPVDNMIIAKYKSGTKNDDRMSRDLAPGECVQVTSKKNINFCKKGATMSLKYEATFEKNQSRRNDYCFSFDFLRVRRQWLPEDDQQCGTTTDINCIIGSGEANAGEECAGNIINGPNLACRDVKVDFLYKYCNFNPMEGVALKFDRDNSFHKLAGERLRQLDRTILRPSEMCRIKRETTTINTCNSETVAELQVTGYLPQSTLTCKSKSVFKVIAAEKCDYNFIITEILQDRIGGHSFVELYSKDCGGQVVMDDLYLVRYNSKGKGKPLLDTTGLKGITIPQSGFLTVCLSDEGKVLFNTDVCQQVTGGSSPADSVAGDSIAIINGKVNGDKAYTVQDAFGDPLNDNSGVSDCDEPRRWVRLEEKGDQEPAYVPSSWLCETASRDNIDPGAWFNFGSYTSLNDRNEPAPSPISSPDDTDNDKGDDKGDDKGNETGNDTGDDTGNDTGDDTGDDCEYNVMITEIVKLGDFIQYIELRPTDICMYGQKILKKHYLNIDGGTKIQLKGKSFDKNGYLVIFSSSYTIKNYSGVDNGSAIGRMNKNPIQIKSSNGRVIDIYNPNPEWTCYEPSGKITCSSTRIARKPIIVVPSFNSQIGDWFYYSDGSMTPGTRNDEPPGSDKSGGSCIYSLIITEIVVFNNQILYMEVQATDKCAYNTKISPGWRLKILGNDNSANLKDVMLNDDGLAIVCTSSQFLRNKIKPSSDLCSDKYHDFGPIGGSTVQLIKSSVIIDTFGYPNKVCNSGKTDICFSNPGRAARKPTIDTPNNNFDSDEWIIIKNGSMTPNYRDDTLPTTSPGVNDKSSGNGKGKGKGKGKRRLR